MTTPATSTGVTQHSAVRPALVLPFDVQPDLAGTMDIQIPSLAWELLPNGKFRRVYYLDGHAVTVEVVEGKSALHFSYVLPDPALSARLEKLLARTFPRMINNLVLDTNPTIRSLSDRYQGVIIMHSDPFEALVLTILSKIELARSSEGSTLHSMNDVVESRLALLPRCRWMSCVGSSAPLAPTRHLDWPR